MNTNLLRVVVFGGRNYDDAERVDAVLDGLHEKRPIGLVIHGGARGADTLGGLWGARRGVHVCVFPANWTLHEKAAGPIRNQAMVDWGLPQLGVKFPGQNGTSDMLRRMRAAGIKVVEVAE